MGRGHGTLNVVEDKAYIVLSVSVSVFRDGDAHEAVADGILTAAELETHQQALRNALRAGFQIRYRQTVVPFGSILLNLPKGSHHSEGRSAEVTAMIVVPLGAKAGQKESIEVQNMLWDPTEKRLKLRATLTESGKTVRTEVAELTPNQNRHRFFSPSRPQEMGRR